MLFGDYDLLIDEKHRISIPAEVRRAINPQTDGEAFYVVTGINDRPWFWPEKHYESLAEGRTSDMAPAPGELAFDHLSFVKARRVVWDKQGRLLLPETTIRKASLGREVTLLASRDHLELWNRADWVARDEELERRRGEIFAQAHQFKFSQEQDTELRQFAGTVVQNPIGPRNLPGLGDAVSETHVQGRLASLNKPAGALSGK